MRLRLPTVPDPIGVEPFFPSLPDDHLLNLMGMRAVEVEGADAAVEMPVTDAVMNHLGALQGGIAAALLDVVTGAAVMRHVGPDRVIATQDMVVRYLGLVRPPTALATARVLRAGRRTVVVDAWVAEATGSERVGVAASASFALLSSTPGSQQTCGASSPG